MCAAGPSRVTRFSFSLFHISIRMGKAEVHHDYKNRWRLEMWKHNYELYNGHTFAIFLDFSVKSQKDSFSTPYKKIDNKLLQGT